MSATNSRSDGDPRRSGVICIFAPIVVPMSKGARYRKKLKEKGTSLRLSLSIRKLMRTAMKGKKMLDAREVDRRES